jgi:hypothetical protein
LGCIKKCNSTGTAISNPPSPKTLKWANVIATPLPVG